MNSLDRRNTLKAAAWTVPAVTAALSVPAQAASDPVAAQFQGGHGFPLPGPATVALNPAATTGGTVTITGPGGFVFNYTVAPGTTSINFAPVNFGCYQISNLSGNVLAGSYYSILGPVTGFGLTPAGICPV